MKEVHVPMIGAWDAWRRESRRLMDMGVPPEAILWRFDDEETVFRALLEPPDTLKEPAGRQLLVPRAFLTLAETVICHSQPSRFSRLYRVLARLQKNRNLLQLPTDQDVHALRSMEKAVRRDAHKMKAFVRFRELEARPGQRRRFGAWFEPSHHVVERVAPFFARRFADMDWVIATPGVTVTYNDGALAFERTSDVPRYGEDMTEALWKTYFSSIFNPARLKLQAMTSEMPKKYWRNLPEAELIPDLTRKALKREAQMLNAPPSSMPRWAEIMKARAIDMRSQTDDHEAPPHSMEAGRHAVHECRRCPLHKCATQAVFGEGPAPARLILVGEQPGDEEDLAGRPFVGPAGRLLADIASEAGLDRSECYVTNAVKHFKFQPSGKRRIHQRPNTQEIQRCRWWLDFELDKVRPQLVVALGATAARALTEDGRAIRERSGKIEKRADNIPVLITIHPSAILRTPDRQAAIELRSALRRDLERAAAFLCQSQEMRSHAAIKGS